MLIKKGIHLPVIAELKKCPLIAKERIRPEPVGETEEATRLLWLTARRNGIGASDIPTIMGTHNPKWGSLYKLWHEKMGLLEVDMEMNDAQWFGHAMEDVAEKALQRDLMTFHAARISNPRYGIAHAMYPWNVASLDRMLFLGQEEMDESENPLWIPVEIKNVSEYKSDDWDISSIPEMYYDQVQNQLEVCGRPCALLVAIFGGNRMGVWTVFRDVIRGGAIMREAEAFWESLKNGECPPPDGSEATREVLLTLHPRNDLPETEMTEQMAEWAEKRTEANREIDRNEKLKNEYENLIRDAMGDAGKAKGFGYSVSYGVQCRKAIDKARADTDPEVIEARRVMEEAKSAFEKATARYVVLNESRVLKITKLVDKTK